MTILHAGGKFGGEGYKVASGLHGVGVSAVNALSAWLEVQVRRDGKLYRQRYERGIPVTPVEELGPAEGSGTQTTFLADEEIFHTIDFKFDTLVQRFREMAFLSKGLHDPLHGRARGAPRWRSTSRAASPRSCAT